MRRKGTGYPFEGRRQFGDRLPDLLRFFADGRYDVSHPLVNPRPHLQGIGTGIQCLFTGCGQFVVRDLGVFEAIVWQPNRERRTRATGGSPTSASSSATRGTVLPLSGIEHAH